MSQFALRSDRAKTVRAAALPSRYHATKDPLVNNPKQKKNTNNKGLIAGWESKRIWQTICVVLDPTPDTSGCKIKPTMQATIRIAWLKAVQALHSSNENIKFHC
ncbi:hypothetical protein TcCL_Unassigned04587 [Trypanosoma cruzi]|nr:hypothetical protein TcCL_Unassigned04587 [Trypanosoma cruzi]